MWDQSGKCTGVLAKCDFRTYGIADFIFASENENTAEADRRAIFLFEWAAWQ